MRRCCFVEDANYGFGLLLIVCWSEKAKENKHGGNHQNKNKNKNKKHTRRSCRVHSLAAAPITHVAGSQRPQSFINKQALGIGMICHPS